MNDEHLTEYGYRYYIGHGIRGTEAIFHDGDGAILTESDVAEIYEKLSGNELTHLEELKQ